MQPKEKEKKGGCGGGGGADGGVPLLADSQGFAPSDSEWARTFMHTRGCDRVVSDCEGGVCVHAYACVYVQVHTSEN